jgi:hypothetical protein
MAILKLEVNKPIEAMLKFAAGRFQAAKNRWPGDDASILYTFTGGDIWARTGEAEAKIYLPIESDQVFADQNIAVGDMFRITKKKTAAKGDYIEVRKLSDSAEPAAALDPRRYPDENGNVTRAAFDALPTAIDATPLERKLTTSINQAQQRKAISSTSAPSAAAATDPRVSETPVQHANGTAPATTGTRAGNVMASALVAAIDACLIARDYAAAKGLPVAFGAEDIRAVANTLYIQACKDPQFLQAAGANPGGQPWRQ